MSKGLTAWAGEPFANVFPNGSFEDTTPAWVLGGNGPTKSCAVVDLDLQKFKDGVKSMKISLPSQGAASLASPLAPVEVGKDYLFTLWYRSEGFSKNELYAGVNASYRLTWYSVEKNEVGHVVVGLPYGAKPEWSLHLRMLAVPKNAVYLGFSLSMSATQNCLPSALWIDRIQLRHWPGQVNAGGKAVTFNIGTQDYFSQELFRKAWDDDAEDGFAAIANPRFSTKPGNLAGYIYTRLLAPGTYRATFRVKVGEAPTEPKPILQWAITTASTGNLSEGMLSSTDFTSAKIYQDFTYRFVVAPSSGWVDFDAYWLGFVTTWIDTITVREEKIHAGDDIIKLLE